MISAQRSSELFVEAFNDRDVPAMEAMLAPDVRFIRPGRTLSGRDEALAQYAKDWSAMPLVRAVIHSIFAHEDNVAIELSLWMHGQEMDQSNISAAAFHTWQNQQLVRYRAFMDPPNTAADSGSRA
jgi:hypothetical protein